MLVFDDNGPARLGEGNAERSPAVEGRACYVDSKLTSGLASQMANRPTKVDGVQSTIPAESTNDGPTSVLSILTVPCL